jgi:ribosomal protein L37AE/L43A
MKSAGIDYGNGVANIDQETGMRYGVIHHGEVGQSWYEDSEAQYDNEHCPECGHDLRTRKNGDLYCPGCKDFDPEYSFDMQKPESFTYDQDGYIAQQSADDCDIFVIKSPYYTYCKFCSPCAPGAGYLMDCITPKQIKSMMSMNIAIETNCKIFAEVEGYIRAYCFGHDWFDNDHAPYPVFSVETGELIKE